jgi:hypothetical protein
VKKWFCKALQAKGKRTTKGNYFTQRIKNAGNVKYVGK